MGIIWGGGGVVTIRIIGWEQYNNLMGKEGGKKPLYVHFLKGIHIVKFELFYWNYYRKFEGFFC